MSMTRKAWAIWQGGRRPDPLHPFLQRHSIGPMHLRQTRHGDLILPLCSREAFQGVFLIPWDQERPTLTIGDDTADCVVPTGRIQAGRPLAVVVDWPSAVVLHKRGMVAWACLSPKGLGGAAAQARAMLGEDGHLLIAGDNTWETSRLADHVACIYNAELLLPGRPLGAPEWVETFADLERWKAGVRRASV